VANLKTECLPQVLWITVLDFSQIISQQQGNQIKWVDSNNRIIYYFLQCLIIDSLERLTQINKIKWIHNFLQLLTASNHPQWLTMLWNNKFSNNNSQMVDNFHNNSSNSNSRIIYSKCYNKEWSNLSSSNKKIPNRYISKSHHKYNSNKLVTQLLNLSTIIWVTNLNN